MPAPGQPAARASKKSGNGQGKGGGEEKRPRWRSPEYPSIGLKTAVELAQKVWDKEKRNQMSVEVGYKHMGFAARSGPALRAVAALKKYGLLVQPNPGRVQLSDEGVQVIVRPHEDPQRLELLQRMAQRPDIFRELFRRFTDGLPSDQNLRTELVAELHFSEEAAATLISVLKETLETVDLRAFQGETRAPAGGDAAVAVPAWPSPGISGAEQVGAQHVSTPDGVATAGRSGIVQLWNVGGGTVVELRANRSLTPAQYDLVAQYVALAKQAEATDSGPA